MSDPRLPDYGFSPSVAAEFGLLEAVLIRCLQIYIDHARAHGRGRVDERVWVHYSARALHKLHPYVSVATINRSLTELRERGVLLVRTDLNSSPYDHTSWYAFAIEAEWLPDVSNCDIDESNRDNDGANRGKIGIYKSPSVSHRESKSRRPSGGGRAPAKKAGGGYEPMELETDPVLASVVGNLVEKVRHGDQPIRDLRALVVDALRDRGLPIVGPRIAAVIAAVNSRAPVRRGEDKS